MCKRRHIKDWIAGRNLRRWMVLKRASALVLWAWKMRDWARESGRGWESNLPRMLLFSSISGGEECGTDVIRRNLPNLSGDPFLFILMVGKGRRWVILGIAEAEVFHGGGRSRMSCGLFERSDGGNQCEPG